MLTVTAFLIPSALLYVRTIRLHGHDVIGEDDVLEAEPAP
jgi:hypothetical protein